MIPTLHTVVKDRGAVVIMILVFLTFMCLLVGAWKLASIPFLSGVAATVMVMRSRSTSNARP